KPREACEAVLNCGQVNAERNASCYCARCILRVVHATKGADTCELGDLPNLPANSTQDTALLGVVPIAQWCHNGNALDFFSGALGVLGSGAAVAVVDADDRCAAGLYADAQPFLDSGVIFHTAVAVEMIFRNVEQNADRGVQRGCEIDLIGRYFQHISACLLERPEREYRHAGIAAHLRIATAAPEQVCP